MRSFCQDRLGTNICEALKKQWRVFLQGKTILGRPWGDLAGVLYHSCYMDDHISKAGWQDWCGETRL